MPALPDPFPSTLLFQSFYFRNVLGISSSISARMFAKSGYPSFDSIPEPDFTSGATALQTTSLNEQTASSNKMSPPVASQRAKPNIPQKKTHVDEMFRLRKELEEAKKARDEAVQIKDMMAEDLLTTQEEVQEKEDEVRKISKEVWAWRDKAERLSNQVKEQKTRQSLMGTETVSASTREVNAKKETEQLQMRQQIKQLTAALAEKDAQFMEKAYMVTGSEDQLQSSIREAQLRFDLELKQKEGQLRLELAEEQKLRQAAEAELNSTKDYYESRHRDIEQLASTKLQEEKKRSQATESALNDQMNRMEIDSMSQQQQEELVATYEAEIRDQRQRCNQFKKTSERLTTQIKQAVEARKDLERSDKEMRQEIEDMKSQIAAQQLQLREYRIPGAFLEGSSH